MNDGTERKRKRELEGSRVHGLEELQQLKLKRMDRAGNIFRGNTNGCKKQRLVYAKACGMFQSLNNPMTDFDAEVECVRERRCVQDQACAEMVKFDVKEKKCNDKEKTVQYFYGSEHHKPDLPPIDENCRRRMHER